MTCGGKIKAPLTGHIDPQMRNRGAFLAHPHTVPEQKLNISQKMTIWKLGHFLLKTILTLCQVIILLYTMSHAHKVVHTSLNSISGQHSASFHMVIENVTDIFFPK